MSKLLMYGGIFIILLLAWTVYGYFASNVELLEYDVVEQRDGYEIRKIQDYLAAEVRLDREISDGVNNEFQLLFTYISGANESQEKISMTAPVIEFQSQNNSEKISMTAPVIVAEGKSFAFVLPAKYTKDTVPVPTNDLVSIREVAGQQVAVLRFRGYLTSRNIKKNKEKLRAALLRDGIEFKEGLDVAGYNAPFTPPFMTRNEIWAYIK